MNKQTEIDRIDKTEQSKGLNVYDCSLILENVFAFLIQFRWNYYCYLLLF